jgi:hypothetical protein
VRRRMKMRAFVRGGSTNPCNGTSCTTWQAPS